MPIKRPVGRPTDYDDSYAEIARALCEFGATNTEIAAHFKIAMSTLYLWQNTIEDFSDAMLIGKSKSDERVKRSFYQRATGYTYTEKQAIKVKTGLHTEEVRVVDVEREVIADVTAATKWLASRVPKEFSESVRLEHSGKVETGGPDLTKMTPDQLAAYEAFLMSLAVIDAP